MAAAADDCVNICLKDLNKKCTIQVRTLRGPQIGSVEPISTLSVLYTGWFQIKTVNIQGTVRVNGVNIDKRSTHVFTTRFRNSIDNLDADGENFIKYSDREYKILEVTNLNEDDEWVIFQCTERGLDSKDAAGA